MRGITVKKVGANNNYKDKSSIVGMAEREGKLIAKVTQGKDATTVQSLLRDHVEISAKLYTDSEVITELGRWVMSTVQLITQRNSGL